MELQLLRKRNHLGQVLHKYLLEEPYPYNLLSNYIDGLINKYPDDKNSIQALEFLRNNINAITIQTTPYIHDCVRNTSNNIQNELIINELLSFFNIYSTCDLNIAIDNLRDELMKEIIEVKNHNIELGKEFSEFKEKTGTTLWI